MALGRGKVASPMLNSLTTPSSSRKAPVLILCEAEWIPTSQDTKQVKKNLHPSATQNRTQAIQLIAKCLAI